MSKMIKSGLTVLLCLLATCFCRAQKPLATLEVDAQSLTLEVPVSVSLDNITRLPDTALALFEVSGGKRTPLPFQVANGDNRMLHWIVTPNAAVKKRTYELTQVKQAPVRAAEMSLTKNDGALVIKSADRNLLQYNFKTVYPPRGIDTVFKRSGFIHPLWSPKGQSLTRIQPPDHYHHYGIWNPWTHLLYKGDTLDLWNLNAKKGTVRFAHFTEAQAGRVFAEYGVMHEHVAFRSAGNEVIINEVQTVRVYRPADQRYYIADITINMTCAAAPVLLLQYRYGGLGWRTTEQWNKDNSEVLTSDGKTRRNADGSKARWCLVQGAIDHDHAGVLMMSSPTNYNHPEPLRIWPEDQYKRGDMFANFSPTKDKDWLLEPGKNYVLRYRFIVFNGPFTEAQSEAAWQNFSAPLSITVKKNGAGN